MPVPHNIPPASVDAIGNALPRAVPCMMLAADADKTPSNVKTTPSIVALAPKEVFGWIHRSYALHELKRTQEARELLLPALKKFPKNETIPYNLACYECQLGDVAAARDWWRRAMKLRNAASLKAQALEDPDLKPLWAEIRDLPIPAKNSASRD